MCRFFYYGAVLALLFWLPGCGGEGGGGTSDAGDNGKTKAKEEPEAEVDTGPLPLKEVTAKELPKTPQEMPPNLDGGRILVKYPKGWVPNARDSSFIVSFRRDGTSGGGPPRIAVKVEEKTPTEIKKTTPENVEDFRDQIGKVLESEEVEVSEAPRPMLLGGKPWVRYVKSARWNKLPMKIQVLQAAHDGRLYSIELQVMDDIVKYRDDAYAIAANSELSEPASP